MELILNLNQYDYKIFLNSSVNTISIALKNFSSGYLKEYDINELPNIINDLHSHNKKIYLALNIIANEEKINLLQNKISSIKDLNIDGFVISDFGILEIFKENELLNKVIFNPVTNITNKYSASIANNLGINHVVLANELNLKDIIEISDYNKGNIEILAQGYYQICNSKRKLLSNFFKQFKIENTNNYYYIKEESREYSYPIIELNNEILIYIDRQRCILPYFKLIKEAKIKYIRIDTIFTDIDEVNLQIDIYNKAIKNITSIKSSLAKIENNSKYNLKCLDNISILKKEKNHE